MAKLSEFDSDNMGSTPIEATFKWIMDNFLSYYSLKKIGIIY